MAVVPITNAKGRRPIVARAPRPGRPPALERAAARWFQKPATPSTRGAHAGSYGLSVRTAIELVAFTALATWTIAGSR